MHLLSYEMLLQRDSPHGYPRQGYLDKDLGFKDLLQRKVAIASKMFDTNHHGKRILSRIPLNKD